MSDQNKLREILEALVVEEFEGVVFVDDNDYSKAEQAILEFINEVIGEPEDMYFTKTIPQNLQELMDYTAKVRANLRAEQRRRAGL